MKKYFLAAITLILLVSCKTKTVVNTPVVTTNAVSSNAAFYKKIKENSDFQQLKISSKINAETGNFIPPLDATIYIKNGEKVWLNIAALFLNVGRGIATTEGIKGYEKWNKTYIESDFAYLNNLLNVNFIDFASLQNLLMGKIFIPVEEKDFIFTKNPQGYNLTSAKNFVLGDNKKRSEYAISIDYSSDFDLKKISLKDVKSSDNLEVFYGNYVTFENLRLPKNVKIIIKGAKSSQILLENTKFDSSKMDTPYSVPNNYTKTEIK